jgi:hypothetical protein
MHLAQAHVFFESPHRARYRPRARDRFPIVAPGSFAMSPKQPAS